MEAAGVKLWPFDIQGLKASQFLQKHGARFARHERDQHDLAAALLHDRSLLRVERLQAVIAPFDVDVRLGHAQKRGRRRLWKDANGINAL